MTTTPLSRTYYYQGEFLEPADFIRDQQYYRDLLAAQNKGLIAPGVADGMELSFAGSVLTVSPGLAFNANGVPIIVNPAVTRDLAGDSLAAGVYYVAIYYGDNNSSSNSQTLQSTKKIVEQPVLPKPVAAAPTAPALVLGQVTVGANGAISATDATGRQSAQSLLAGSVGAPAPGAAALAVAPAAPGGLTAGETVASLAVGDPLAGAGAVGKAPLTVGLDFTASAGDGSVAGFGFENGSSQAGVVTLGLPAGAGFDMINVSYNGNRVWSVDQTGQTYSVSDLALKTDVEPVKDAVEIIKGLTGVAYLPAGGQDRRVGLVAQHVAAVLPEAVHTDGQGLHAVSYNAVVGVLVEAVKVLSERVEALEAAHRPRGKSKIPS
ncbi:MAG: hypothetical protein GC145_14870 [Caulobacter sp.]|nr:hypothetical protein [Caulobacter sp.]